mmetsp:Transcript_88448/g.270727  ORF Transcript_88448/g.270727 Transcript_88448/m.270727 type:complete len:272 (-) Transcript_88448:320-1135(-)
MRKSCTSTLPTVPFAAFTMTRSSFSSSCTHSSSMILKAAPMALASANLLSFKPSSSGTMSSRTQRAALSTASALAVPGGGALSTRSPSLSTSHNGTAQSPTRMWSTLGPTRTTRPTPWRPKQSPASADPSSCMHSGAACIWRSTSPSRNLDSSSCGGATSNAKRRHFSRSTTITWGTGTLCSGGTSTLSTSRPSTAARSVGGNRSNSQALAPLRGAWGSATAGGLSSGASGRCGAAHASGRPATSPPASSGRPMPRARCSSSVMSTQPVTS